jgi:hypothetical protein
VTVRTGEKTFTLVAPAGEQIVATRFNERHDQVRRRPRRNFACRAQS